MRNLQVHELSWQLQMKLPAQVARQVASSSWRVFNPSPLSQCKTVEHLLHETSAIISNFVIVILCEF